MYSHGSLRIKNPKTLQAWIDRGWYQEILDSGYIYAVGCGRFRSEVCGCTNCRTPRNPSLSLEIREVLDKNL
jgi:hypothetical protein